MGVRASSAVRCGAVRCVCVTATRDLESSRKEKNVRAPPRSFHGVRPMPDCAPVDTATRNGAHSAVFYTKKLRGTSYAPMGSYCGDWKGGLWEGRGTLERPNGDRYIGDFVAGKRDGKGTLWVKACL